MVVGLAGDCITLTSKILNISPLEAAKYLNEMLHLGIETTNNKVNKSQVNRYIEAKKAKERFDKWENEMFQCLCDCYHILCDWKKRKAGKDEYIYSLKNIEYLGYIIDEVFIYGTDEDKIWFRRNLGKKVDEWKKTILMNNI